MGIFDWLFGKKENTNTSNNNEGKTLSQHMMDDEDVNTTLKDYYDTGELFFEFTPTDYISCIEGKNTDGYRREYYKNGNLKEEGNLINGKPKGLYKEYDETGKLQRELNFINGNPEGLIKDYYETGEIKEEWFIKDGVRHGNHKSYSISGELTQESNWKNGKEV